MLDHSSNGSMCYQAAWWMVAPCASSMDVVRAQSTPPAQQRTFTGCTARASPSLLLRRHSTQRKYSSTVIQLSGVNGAITPLSLVRARGGAVRLRKWRLERCAMASSPECTASRSELDMDPTTLVKKNVRGVVGNGGGCSTPGKGADGRQVVVVCACVVGVGRHAQIVRYSAHGSVAPFVKDEYWYEETKAGALVPAPVAGKYATGAVAGAPVVYLRARYYQRNRED
ncbi:hypothetical protein THASP1DRAFT_22800 [Thamnocephalis sphaerospora]|uniref:Uncharacterized protein n=1 Tax=Thamnocephalis sphaerospora TaxID=78915 RepID=A0A4V1IX03_9FUNG|nr:hypothetical protein THASP1DRAFT_22800 [Thamnocephalis sphaerospora]|eukprot:RKP09359.1 hypothetical protein THASP1DRAFT_22800 [Thamnocephalis sphaerospora]